MRRLSVYLERLGTPVYVGAIAGSSARDASFAYDPDYVVAPESVPLSLGLPLRREPFDPELTRLYFEGLLPEGFTRRCVAEWIRVPEDDYLSILARLGSECIGAVMVLEEDGAESLAAESRFPDRRLFLLPAAGYRPLSTEEMAELAAEGASESAQLVTESHLSLAGATGKVGLYRDADGGWFLPWGTAPSTHILKQSHVRLAGIVANELLCLRVARRCGINAADSFVVELGNVAAGQPSDRDVLFASERYDRRFGIDPAVLDGHPVPYRLHQEDFSQALGISHSMKYERDGCMYLRQMFELLRSQSTSPYQDRLALWDLTVFNCLIGNTDAHLKNVSLMYSADWDELRLAPAYDIVSTVFYPQCTDELAFAIGGVRRLGELDRAAFERAADQVSMGRVAAMRRLDDMVERFPEVLDDEARRLADEGFPVALTIWDAILERGCVKALRSARG